MVNRIENLFTEDVIRKIRNEIRLSYNNEVLFFSWINDTGIINKVEVIARGNDECVSFPIQRSYLPDVVIHNHPDGILTPSNADMSIANFIAQRGVGFIIINNELTEIYTAVEPVKKKVFIHIDENKCVGYLSRGSGVEKIIDNFEDRIGQKDMIKKVCYSFNEDKIALIEAGTGIGKSFAYLIPAIEWAIVNKERVIISTKTINLQEQLLNKDIPMVKKIMGRDFEYTLLKGRGNYICLNRIMEVSQDLFSFIDDEEQEQFDSILTWVRRTNDGSISDLSFTPSFALWEKINSKTEACLGAKCKYFSECFVNKAKRDALRSHIVITNHHYFLADATLSDSGVSVLPNYSRVIFDEAHGLEDSATSFFTKILNRYTITSLLSQLYRHGKGSTEKGYISYLKKKNLLPQNDRLGDVIATIEELKKHADILFTKLGDFIKNFLEEETNLKENISETYQVIEVNEYVKNQHGWKLNVLNNLDILYKLISTLENKLLEIRKYLDSKKRESETKQLDGYVTRLIDILQTVDIFLKDDDSEYVRWIEKTDNPRILVSLIEIGKQLENLVYNKAKTLIFTSATLTVKGEFGFLKERLGISRETLNVKIESPFDYKNQMAIMIPNDIAEPQQYSYLEDLSSIILDFIEEIGGSTLILFTSYSTLNYVYSEIYGYLSRKGFFVLKQGDKPRQLLLNDFKAQSNAVLFGTESFWEGIDVPGKNLQCVIITRLPFKVPTDPVIKARMKRVEFKGKNPFINYLLPLAVLKTKQGVGRLIRKSGDRGIIVILDKRIITKNYGDIFIKSLPEGSLFIAGVQDLLPVVKNFTNSE